MSIEMLDMRQNRSYRACPPWWERSRRVNGLVCLILVFTIGILSCGTRNNHLSENQKTLISELDKIKNEDLFSQGANNWAGYTGCKNRLEKRAYSANIISCVNDLEVQICDSADLVKLKEIIIKYEESAEVLEEEFRADTDESEIRWMYFDRVRNIVGVQK